MVTLDESSRIGYRPYAEYRPHVESSSGPAVSTALVWSKIWRRKWLIGVVSALLFGVLAAILFVLPVWYTASSEIVVEQRPQGVDIAAVLSRIPTDSQAILTEAEALRSRTLVQQTIRQLNLLDNPEFNPKIIPDDGSLRSHWRRTQSAVMAFIESVIPRNSSPSPGDPTLNEATDIFLKNLRVTPIGRSQVLRATFTSESPELSSAILNALVDRYLEAQIENRVSVPTKVGDFLKEQLGRLQTKVRDSNEAVERFRNQAQLHQGLSQGRETLLYTQELGESNRELVAVRLKRQEAEARLKEIRANPSAFPDVLASPVIQQLRKQQSLLREERAQLVASHGPSYPKVQQVEASIADGERRLNAESANVIRSIASEVTVNTAREAELVHSIANLKDQIRDAASSRVTLASLEQEAEVNRGILNTFLTQYNQLTTQRALQIADSYVLARAMIPTRPSFPPTIPFLGLAFVVSIVLAVFYALLLERTGKTIRSSYEVLPLLTARSLAVIPKLSNRSALPTQVIDSPQSQFTESIRSILSLFMAPRSFGRAIVLASAQPREGRTSLAVAIARLAAVSGRRAILIDCDLRRPSLHLALGTNMGQGLTDLLQNRLDASSVIRRDALTSLDYITGGELAPHAANLLGRPEMTALLAKLRTEYDLLILDSPPSGSLADTSFIAQMADECLFVVRWNKTPWRLVREQMEALSHHCNVTGVILNQVDMRKHTKYHPAQSELTHSPVLIGTSG